MLKLLGVVLIVSFLTFMLTKLLPGKSGQHDPRLGGRPTPSPRAALEERARASTSRSSRSTWHYLHGVVTECDLGKSYSRTSPTTTLPGAAAARPRSSS